MTRGIPLDSVVSKVLSIDRRGDHTIVEVRVKGVRDKTVRDLVGKDTPNIFANLRARSKALIAAGVLPSSVQTVKDVAMGDIDRLTKVVSEQEEGDSTAGVVDKVYTIRVNS